MTAAALKDLQPRTGTPIFVFKNQKDDFQILNTQVFKSEKRSTSLNISTSSNLKITRRERSIIYVGLP